VRRPCQHFRAPLALRRGPSRPQLPFFRRYGVTSASYSSGGMTLYNISIALSSCSTSNAIVAFGFTGMRIGGGWCVSPSLQLPPLSASLTLHHHRPQCRFLPCACQLGHADLRRLGHHALHRVLGARPRRRGVHLGPLKDERMMRTNGSTIKRFSLHQVTPYKGLDHSASAARRAAQMRGLLAKERFIPVSKAGATHLVLRQCDSLGCEM
jgi:hypothetical protein